MHAAMLIAKAMISYVAYNITRHYGKIILKLIKTCAYPFETVAPKEDDRPRPVENQLGGVKCKWQTGRPVK